MKRKNLFLKTDKMIESLFIRYFSDDRFLIFSEYQKPLFFHLRFYHFLMTHIQPWTSEKP
ncbi:MAG: hypothetical protein A2026_07990 [Deltaproteobacteria bacterium RBG_19FT_COMBO_46_12]|nr:MAG: hypothetical protein A2026_07990 [Deltaproteobacteria bacterium RBG_19FT_COMBO_46_12]